jgi:hypothetical protein
MPAALFRDGVRFFGRQDMAWAARNLLGVGLGGEGKEPAQLSVYFPASGFTAMRSDWSPGARYMLINHGPSGGGHSHADSLDFSLHAFGQAMAIDSGIGYTYDDPNQGPWYIRTRAHNCLTVDDQVLTNRSGLEKYVGRDLILGIRPEDFEDASIESDAPPDRRVKVTADLTEPLGSEVLVHFGTQATGVVPSAAAADVGEDAEVRLGGDENLTTRLVARVSPKSRIAVGSEIELAVDTSRLYFFDPETRDAI